MSAIRGDILTALCSMPVEEFLHEFLFDRIPYIFDGNRSTFITWKSRLSNSIDVDPACILFVGSSALGASLNPNKGFKAFDEQSDVDVAIISNYYFTVAWRFLRTQGHRRTSIDRKTLAAWDDHCKRLIYWGTIATDKLLGILPFGVQWLAALTHMANLAPTIGRDINLRIYSDYESLRAYQTLSVKNAREEIILSKEK